MWTRMGKRVVRPANFPSVSNNSPKKRENLPALQIQKDEEEAVTQGLDQGGKRLKSTGKAKRGPK